MKTERYPLIDVLRGAALLNMFVYHALWNNENLFGYNTGVLHTLPAYLWQQSGAALFILLSGFCWALAHKHLQRSLVVLGCAFFIFIVTYFFDRHNLISFGILSFIGSAMLLMLPFAKLLRHITPTGGLITSFILFFAFKNINHGYISFGDWQCSLPQSLYANYFTAWLGLPPDTFQSADYFPLLPWLFIYTAGYFACLLSKKHLSRSALLNIDIKPLSLLGRHSLAAYLIHQPVIYGLMWLWYKVLN